MSLINRGDIIYVADGTYNATTFSKAPSGSTLITVRKATVADHGTNTGWLNSYGSGQAVWTGGTIFSTDYWLFTGSGRTGFRSGYGFKCENNNGSNAPFNGTACLYTSNIASNITINYVEVDGSHDRTGTYTDDGIFLTSDFVNHPTGNTVGYNWIHDVGEMFIQTRDQINLTIEQNWMVNNQSTAAHHAEGIGLKESGTCGITIRWNYMENVEGTANIADPAGLDHFTYCNWAIYGNVFFYNSAEASSGLGGAGDGILSNLNGSAFTGFFYFVNNTIASWDRVSGAGQPKTMLTTHGLDNAYSTVVIENNLWYDNNGHGTSGTSGPSCTLSDLSTGGILTAASFTCDYNAYYDNDNNNDRSAHKQTASGNPFVDAAYNSAGHTDFRLRAQTTPGQVLPSPYNVDMNGNVRGADGTWDRGAFEFVGSGQTLAAPIGVHIIP